jgi:transcriptional regulator with XRE-family HTH domain
MTHAINPRIIEAEENLLIDFHMLLQEMMVEQGISRSQLAERAGVSKARLSQILSVEANPTIKSMARLFQALGHEVCVSKKPRMDGTLKGDSAKHSDWNLGDSPAAEVRRDDSFVDVIKKEYASNDNYAPRVLFLESSVSPLVCELEAEAA